MKPLTNDQFSQWEKSYQETQKLESVIQDRVGYVVDIWTKAFGGKLKNWYFDSAKEGQVGCLIDHYYADSISGIYTECSVAPNTNDKYEMVIITKDGGEWGWDGSIPLRWLFEDCEEEIINGKVLYDEKLKKKKADSDTKKKSKEKLDNDLVKQAKSKLTKEELAALKQAGFYEKSKSK